MTVKNILAGMSRFCEFDPIPDRWGAPDICKEIIKDGKTYYYVSVPHYCIQPAVSDRPWKTHELRYEYAIEKYYYVVGETVINKNDYWRGDYSSHSYRHDWAWVKTTNNGAHQLLMKLGYVFFEFLTISSWEVARNKAKLHAIDMRIIEVNGITILCFRDEEDAALLRLCI